MRVVRRHACRALLVTPERKILLIKITNPDGDWKGWITPGGGIESEEDEFTGLARELREELGYMLTVQPPKVWRRFHRFPWDGEMYEQEESFFLIRTPHFEPHAAHALTEAEQRAFLEFRWWKLQEMEASGEVFAPRALAREVERLLAGDLPDPPLEIGL